MEREAVLHWLQDVQAAVQEESDEGFVYPEKSIPSSSTAQLSSKEAEQTHDNPQLTTGAVGLAASLTPSSPQFPRASTAASARRAAFKLARSNTLSGDPFKSDTRRPDFRHLTQTHKAPSFDVPEGHRRFHNLSPLPSSNPDFIVPTINLNQEEPERKPLTLQNTELLSRLKTKKNQLLQSSKWKSVDLAHVKSAPTSPCWQKEVNMYSTSVSLSQCDEDTRIDLPQAMILEKGAQTDNMASENSGSCVAEQGGSSDGASSDGGMPSHESAEKKEEAIASNYGTDDLQDPHSGFQHIVSSALQHRRKKTPLQRSFSVQHIRSQSDTSDRHTALLGSNSLTFHDHHLGRMATHRLTRNPTFDESSAPADHD